MDLHLRPDSISITIDSCNVLGTHHRLSDLVSLDMSCDESIQRFSTRHCHKPEDGATERRNGAQKSFSLDSVVIPMSVQDMYFNTALRKALE
jgi:hypothetical protein